MATLQNIQAKIAKLQAEAEAIVKKQSSAVSKIGELMEKHGLTLADLESHLGGGRRRQSGVQDSALVKPSGNAKYLDPKTGGDLDRPRSCAELDRQCEGQKQVSD